VAITAARTSTKAYPRLSLLCMQVRRLLRRTTDIDDETLDLLVEGVKQRWFKRVSSIAVGNDELCWAKIALDIDWDEHSRQLSRGQATILIDSRKWRDDTAIEVDECINTFNAIVEEDRLTTEWRVAYSDWVKRDRGTLDYVRSTLDLRPADPVKWGGSIIGEPFSIAELPELKIGSYFGDK